MTKLYNSIVVLVSGGLDSDVLLADLAQHARRVYPVFVRQGLAWESVELYWLKRYLKALKIASLQPLQILSLPLKDVYGDHWSTGSGKVPGGRTADASVFLPGRNLVLVLKAAIFARLQGVRDLALGSLGHNPFPDATPAFFRDWSRVLSEGLGKPIKVLAPYRALEKSAVIQRGRRLPLELSFSCISPHGRDHCGRCNKCAERRRAFRAADIPDLTRYARS